MSRRERKQRWKPVTALFGVSVIFSVALLEMALYFLDDRYKGNFKVPPVSSENFQEEAYAFFHSESFDADLGWDYRPPVRNYLRHKVFLAQAYGDSFVLSGHGGITWQAAFENITGEAILNFGVGGYGLDQAVLKFERYSSEYPTRIAVLGLYHQTFRRALSYHARYYFSNPEKYKFAFKPFFVGKGAHYELYTPPCTDASCMWDVLYDPDNEVRKIRSSYDYWYRNNIGKPTLRFPRIPKYARALPAIWRSTKWDRRSENYYFANNKSLELTKYLVERFVVHAEGNGMVPICLLLYSSSDLLILESGSRYDKGLVDFLKAEQIRYVDTGKYILERYSEDDDFKSLRIPDGHLNNRGDRMVAAALAQGLAEMGLLEGKGKP